MRKFTQAAVSIFLFGWTTFSCQATFTSLYVFGDALSATWGNYYGTNSAGDETKDYYGGRYCNGRVWVEVLAQRLGIGISNNLAFYDCGSADLSNVVKSFSISPSVAPNALFVVWSDNADLYDVATESGNNWAAAISAGTNNEFYVITNLYGKGVRTLIMPSVVDISQVPNFSQGDSGSYLQTMHNESIAYNTAFSNMLNQARAACPNVTIYEPDFFGLLNDVLTNAVAFGLTNAYLGTNTIGAMQYYASTYTNGPGTNFIYWDYLDPTAKLHEIMADTTMQMVAPVSISKVTLLSPASASLYTNELTVMNMPVGLNGFVDGTSNLAQNGWAWATVTNITSTNPVQSVFVDALPLPPIDLPSGSGPPPPPGIVGADNVTTATNALSSYWQSYRLRFPMAWSWP